MLYKNTAHCLVVVIVVGNAILLASKLLPNVKVNGPVPVQHRQNVCPIVGVPDIVTLVILAFCALIS